MDSFSEIRSAGLSRAGLRAQWKNMYEKPADLSFMSIREETVHEQFYQASYSKRVKILPDLRHILTSKRTKILVQERTKINFLYNIYCTSGILFFSSSVFNFTSS